MAEALTHKSADKEIEDEIDRLTRPQSNGSNIIQRLKDAASQARLTSPKLLPPPRG
ncbi:hypothetical protein LCGC14_3111780 [marine sediment metagenome]|uniref:Uncharacterized protein n=1 Tax=marine sediment metagenome TaxID=412755 RepID=A0A0F8W582_9ZZZZ